MSKVRTGRKDMASKFREPHYYSDRLRRKLNGLCSARTTVVEALSGYGKTTAIGTFRRPPG